MYRAVTLKVIRRGLSPRDAEGIERLLDTTRVEFRRTGGAVLVLLDGEDVTEAIRSPEVSRAVSAVSMHPAVRKAMVREQRLMGKQGEIVLDGRDIGTVVFPDADIKFFMVANLEERARRRLAELRAKGIEAHIEELRREISERDTADSTRQESPLRRADDAIDVDTSALTIEQQVEFVLSRVEAKLKKEDER